MSQPAADTHDEEAGHADVLKDRGEARVHRLHRLLPRVLRDDDTALAQLPGGHRADGAHRRHFQSAVVRDHHRGRGLGERGRG